MSERDNQWTKENQTMKIVLYNAAANGKTIKYAKNIYI